MTNNKPNDVRVSRELLNTACNGLVQEQARALNQLRAILSQPADQQGELVAEVFRLRIAQENHYPIWRNMDSAPKDGTMLRLLVQFTEHATEDADEAATIGANNCDNDEIDRWQFAGWCWTHDHFTEGQGEVVGWLPMFDSHAQPATAKVDERAEFEEFFNDAAKRLPLIKGKSTTRYAGGQYVNDYALFGFMAWQARAKLNGGQS